jgi:hypothetical protein
MTIGNEITFGVDTFIYKWYKKINGLVIQYFVFKLKGALFAGTILE